MMTEKTLLTQSLPKSEAATLHSVMLEGMTRRSRRAKLAVSRSPVATALRPRERNSGTGMI